MGAHGKRTRFSLLIQCDVTPAVCLVAQTFLEKRYADDMELEDAIHTALLTLKEGFEGQISSENIEVGIVGGADGNVFRVLTPAEVKDYLDEVE